MPKKFKEVELLTGREYKHGYVDPEFVIAITPDERPDCCWLMVEGANNIICVRGNVSEVKEQLFGE
jgi:hypothetical protein